MGKIKIEVLKIKIQEGIDSRIAINFNPKKHLELLKTKVKKLNNHG